MAVARPHDRAGQKTASQATHARGCATPREPAGTSHTQWCDHEMGEAISIANAPRPVPST